MKEEVLTKREELPIIAAPETAILAAIVQSSDDAIISKNLDGIVTSWNDAAQRIFGYTADEMIGTSITRLIPHDRLEEEPNILGKLRRGERVDHFETKRVAKHNRILDISLTISPIKDHTGKIIGASKIARDITAQKAAERQIRESEERIRMAMETTRLGTWDYYCQAGTIEWSKECRNIYQFPDGVEIDYSVFARLIHPEDSLRVLEAIENAMAPQGTGDYRLEFRICRYMDHEIRWIRSQGKVYFDEHNQPERFIGTVLDITEEKAIKDVLEKTVAERTKELTLTNKQLEKSNNELEQFAYIASHDLQEPLRKIQTYADLLYRNRDVNPAAENYFGKITAAATRMSALIKDVLNYSRLSEQQTPKIAIDLNSVIKDVLNDFEIVIEERKVKIFCDALPEIKGSRAQMHQLFANLISNAIKFSTTRPEIHITSRNLPGKGITALHKDLSHSDTFAEISIKDNGIGFDQQYAEQIFVIFQRLNTRHQYTGTGIGLALCQKIVQNHGGVISAESTQGNGATFKFILPVS